MSEFIREVEEDIRRERLTRVWKRFAPFVYAAAALIVIITAGYRGYEYWQETRAARSGDSFLAAMELLDAGDSDAAITAFTAIENEGTGQYPVLASFKKASLESGDAGIAAYDALAANSGVPANLQNLARVRAAYLLVDDGSLKDVEERVGSLIATDNPYRHSAREVIALVAYARGDLQRAADTSAAIIADEQTPSPIRQRAQLIADVVASKQ
jgi:hypothetical protein